MILGSVFHDFGLHQMAFQLIQKVQTDILTDASVDDGFHSPNIFSIFGLNEMSKPIFDTEPSGLPGFPAPVRDFVLVFQNRASFFREIGKATQINQRFRTQVSTSFPLPHNGPAGCRWKFVLIWFPSLEAYANPILFMLRSFKNCVIEGYLAMLVMAK